MAPYPSADRPERVSTYVFEYYESEVEIEDREGRRSYAGDVCILSSPGRKAAQRASPQARCIWLHLQGEGLAACLRHYQIPVDRALAGVLEPSTLITFLENVRRRLVQCEAYWEDGVTLLCDNFFRDLSRAIAQGAPSSRPSVYQQENLAILRQVRTEIHSNLDRRWSVDEMAALSNLSASRYRELFTHFFQVSPVEDLTRARIRRAMLLLRAARLSVREVAEQCGFNSLSQFHVSFRERTGHSPGDLMKSEGAALSGEAGAMEMDRESIDDVALLYFGPAGCWRFSREDGGDQDYHLRFGALRLHQDAAIGDGALLLERPRAHAEIAEPIVDTAASYTVCAWVCAETPAVSTDWMTAVSIGNESHCSFYLQYCLLEGRFMFTATPSDTDCKPIHVRGSLIPEMGRWFHLTGVYDRERGTISLWENGEWSAELPCETSWRAPGPTRFGASVFWGTLTDFWTGRLTGIRVYSRALSDAEIKTIYHHSRGN